MSKTNETPEEIIEMASYPEDENINGSPQIVNKMVALAQIERARQEEQEKIQQLKKRVITGDGSPRTLLKENVLKWIDEIVTQPKTKGENSRMKN